MFVENVMAAVVAACEGSAVRRLNMFRGAVEDASGPVASHFTSAVLSGDAARVGYASTEYAYRGDEWVATAYFDVARDRYSDAGGFVLRVELSDVQNLTRRADYGFDARGLTDAQRRAAYAAVSALMPDGVDVDQCGRVSVDVSHGWAFGVALATVRRAMEKETFTWTRDAESYATAWKRHAGDCADDVSAWFGEVLSSDDAAAVARVCADEHVSGMRDRAAALVDAYN